MLATKVLCPHCRKHLKTSKPLTVGHRVLCPRCGRSFAVPSEGSAAANRDVSPQPSLRLDPAHVETVPEVEIPSSAPRRQALWIGLILGGLGLLLIATLGLVVFFATRTGPMDVPVETAASSPSDDAIPTPVPPRDDIPPPPNRERDDSPLVRESPLVPTEASVEPKQKPWLPPEEQEQVNETIERGVQWLKKHQGSDGSWGPRLGLAALPALTLLECGVPADDIRIKKALHHVRKAIPALNQTYDLALAILFLDRLGDPADKKRIQTCALRLAAGQSQGGGWTYACPILTSKQEDDLLTVMRERRPRDAMDLFVGGADGSAPPGFIARTPGDPLDKGISGDTSGDSKLLPEGGTMPLDGPSGGGVKPLETERPSPEAAKRALNRLPPHIQKLPSLQPPRLSHKLPARDASDNSNTQFAILGLLAAARHDLPLERACALIVHRFHSSQVPDGRWNYLYSAPAQAADLRPAMTGAGLLGLAVQYGLAADQAQPRGKPRQIDDPAVEKGFKYLSQFIGKPLGVKRPRVRRNQTDINLYFLWTVERCGVLYNRRQIEGKDWYTWGAELLLDDQQNDGSWNTGGYFAPPDFTPTTDTCFALLFLKRANLAKELTKKLEFFMEGKKLQTSP